MFDLTGKVALVTGSTQGIGFAIAEAFIKAGAQVFIHCSADEQKAERVARMLGAHGAVTADLGDAGAADSLYQRTGAVDILVLNASVQYRTPWQKIGAVELDTQLTVNFKSTLALIQRYYPDMEKKGWGRVITIGSVQEEKPHPDMAVYAATKSATVNLVRNLAKQVAPYGITVNNMAPGAIATPRNEAALSNPAYAKKVLSGIPMGYVGEPEDLAGIALLLASEAGRYITGTDMLVDGGMSL